MLYFPNMGRSEEPIPGFRGSVSMFEARRVDNLVNGLSQKLEALFKLNDREFELAQDLLPRVCLSDRTTLGDELSSLREWYSIAQRSRDRDLITRPSLDQVAERRRADAAEEERLQRAPARWSDAEMDDIGDILMDC